MTYKRRKFLSGFLVFAFLMGMVPVNTAVHAATPDLLISEYIEGSSYNKAIEIYNGTGTAIDLTAGLYSLELYSNGSLTPSQFMMLSGTVADGDVFVLAHGSADAAILSQADETNSSVINFNGDDAVVLRKNGVVVDAFGQIDVDPGSEWPGGGANDTLRRKADVCAGDTNAADAFDASVEWNTNAQDTFDGLGTHTANCGEGPPPEPEVLLTEFVVTPTEGEFVEIHNPTAATIDLSDYYITDATYSYGGDFYYNIVTGNDAGGGGYGDFHARFPDEASIDPNEYQTIAIAGSADYMTEYGTAPDYELFDDNSDDGELVMREALPGSINGQGGLTNNGEVVILYSWDGEGDLVTDADYVVWGDKVEAVDKTGVSIDGPDADDISSPYLADTAVTSQDVVGIEHANGNSWQREDLTEGTEIISGGNGFNGEDETSENFSETWCESPPTPGTVNYCIPPLEGWVINEVHADPDGSIAGDANGDGTRDSGDDEFVEIVNNSGDDADIGGWMISDGVGVRHTFPAGTFVPDGCAIVVFGGGSPTGLFGRSLVQTASSGLLGFNNDGDSVALTDIDGNVAGYNYGSEGGYNQSLTRDPDIVGPEPLIQHSSATGSDGALYSPGTLIDGSQFAGCPTERKIHEVQGSGSASPLVDRYVIIEGIVVGDFQDGASGVHGDLNGFHVQEEDADVDLDPFTSEGIFIYDGSSPGTDVEVGDLVRVMGKVSEYEGLTEITSFTGVTVLSSGNSLPTVTPLSLPVASTDAFEAYEGMYVTFLQALIISEYYNFDRYGEIVLTSERHLNPVAEFEPGSDEVSQAAQEYLLDKITLDDGRGWSNPDPALHPNGGVFDLSNLFRGGDTIQNVTGVMDYARWQYRVQPTQGVDYTKTNPRSALPDDVGGSLKVASMNVLNYFTTYTDSNDLCGPFKDQECRGADDADEFDRQRDKIFAAISTIDADIVGLVEIENNADDEAVQDLVDGLNAGTGTYDYVQTGPIGGDAIKVALIYKPALVSLYGDYAILDSTVDPRFIDTRNRPVIAQTFMDNITGGLFTVAVNHLKSKGTPCDDIGDPDTGDGSGNCNLTRKSAAEAMVDWLASDPTGSGDADFLVIGDLNSYDKEEPIDVLRAGGFADLIYEYLGEAAYSYVFDGQIGYLDYAMAGSGLVDEVTGVTVWHINADEPDLIDYDTTYKQDPQDAIYAPDAYRSSDHDPVITGLSVCDEIAPVFDGMEVTPAVLWPVNHRYVKVTVTVDVSDNFDQDPTVTLVSVTSNEPDNGEDDGNTVNDIVILNDFRFKLRAERSGIGTGRIYTITYQLTDDCGNSTTQSVEITVPLSMGK